MKHVLPILALLVASSTTSLALAADPRAVTTTAAPKDFVQGLIDLLAVPNEEKQRYAVSGLTQRVVAPERVLPAFLKLLGSDFSSVRSSGAYGLGHYGEKSRFAVPELLKVLQGDKKEDVSVETARALTRIDPENPAVIAALAHVATQPRDRASFAAIEALGEIGSGAHQAAPTLVGLLSTQPNDAETSARAFEALGQIQRKRFDLSTSQAALLLQQLDAAPKEHLAAAFAILREHPTRDLAPTLIAILQTRPEPHFRHAAIGVLEKIGVGSSEATTRAMLLQLERENIVARAAERAFWFVQEGDEPAVAPLAQALEHRSSLVRRVASQALAEIGPQAEGASAALIRVLQKELGSEYPSYQTVQGAARALTNIELKASGVASDVLELLDAPTPPRRHDFRPQLLAVLAAVGAPPNAIQRQKTLKHVLEGLQNPSPALRAGAARVAATLGKDAAPAVPLLIAVLDFKAFDVPKSQLFEGIYLSIHVPTHLNRSELDTYKASHSQGATTASLEAIRALARIGSAAHSAIPTLNRYAQSRDGEPLYSFYRQDARDALQRIQKP